MAIILGFTGYVVGPSALPLCRQSSVDGTSMKEPGCGPIELWKQAAGRIWSAGSSLLTPALEDAWELVIQEMKPGLDLDPDPDSFIHPLCVEPHMNFCGSVLPLSPHCALCRLPDPQRTHVMWGTSKVGPWLALGVSGRWEGREVGRTGSLCGGLATALGVFLLQDFGMSGLRFGTLYTENQDVATAVASLCRYHGLSGLVQYQMAQLLQDRGDRLGLTT